MGRVQYLKKGWHWYLVAVISAHVVDMLLFAGGVGRPLRLLRGMPILLRARTLRKM